MKKFITLVLALALVLGLAAPAMAFTTTAPGADLEPSLDIYLVEYDNDEFFGFTSLPQSDRGYAKNEIVAAVVELTVPDDYGTLKSGALEDYYSLVFSGKNVTLNVTDNSTNFRTTANVKYGVTGAAVTAFTFSDIANTKKITMPITTTGFADDDTYKFLFFAKVTGDDASLTAKLVATDNSTTFAAAGDTLKYGKYTVAYADPSTGSDIGTFTITKDGSPAVPQFSIDVDTSKKFKSTDMYIYDGALAEKYTVAKGTDGGLVFIKSATSASGDTYKKLLAIYEDVVEDVFGFNFDAKGGVVNFKTFTSLTGGKDIVATVDIEPWTAYVTVPDEVIVTPPKTGDAASILGFVMVALSGAGAVALRKRG